MRRCCRPVGLLLLVAGLPLSSAAEPGGADAPGLDPERLTWRELSLSASKFGLTSSSVVRIAPVAAQEAERELLPAGQGTPLQPDGAVLEVELETRFLGRVNLVRAWFDPRRATAFQRIRLDSGRRRGYKASRFTREGLLSRRRSPRRDQPDEDPDTWEPGAEQLDPYPDWLEPEEPITLPGVLLYVASVAPLAEDAPGLQIATFASHSVSMVTLVVEGRETIAVDYLERLPDGEERRVEGPVSALRVALRSLAPDDPDGDLGLLGLRGAVRILIDPVARVPLEVRGRVPVVGLVHVRLEQVELRDGG